MLFGTDKSTLSLESFQSSPASHSYNSSIKTISKTFIYVVHNN